MLQRAAQNALYSSSNTIFSQCGRVGFCAVNPDNSYCIASHIQGRSTTAGCKNMLLSPLHAVPCWYQPGPQPSKSLIASHRTGSKYGYS